MSDSEASRQNGIDPSFFGGRNFLICMILLSSWSLYLKLRHSSGRFNVPHDLVSSFAIYGVLDRPLNLFFYLFIGWLFIEFVRAARSWTVRILVTTWIAPVLLNPLKMLIPKYCFVVWWVQLLAAIVFFVVSIAAFTRRAQDLSRDSNNRGNVVTS